MAEKIEFDAVVPVESGKSIELPSGDFVANAEFVRQGSDLYLTSPDGHTIKVEGYFDTMPTSDIVTADGAYLSPEMVDAFLPPQHVGEYAAAGNSTNDVSPAGQITELVGEVVIVRADGTRVTAEVGTPVYPGDVVETSGEGAANILFADNTTFAISENARLSIDEFVYSAAEQSGSSFFSMLQGVFVYTSGLIGKNDPGNVNIETPVGSIGIRGTVVAGDINPAGEESKITVIDGAIVLTNGGGSLEMNTSFQTASLSSYQQQPTDMGTIDFATFTQSYQAAASVSGDTFSSTSPYAGSAPAQSTAPAQEATDTAPETQEKPASETESEPPTQGETGTGEITPDPIIFMPPPPLPQPIQQDAKFDKPGDGTTFGTTSLSGTDATKSGTTYQSPLQLREPVLNGTTDPVIGTLPPPPPPPLPPVINFIFSHDYTKGTGTTADDGVSPFATGWTGNEIGRIDVANMPVNTRIEITGFGSGGIMLGNTLVYDPISTPIYDTNVIGGQDILQYNTATKAIEITDRFAMLANVQGGNISFTINLVDNLTNAVIGSRNVLVQLKHLTGVLADSNIFIGDPSASVDPNQFDADPVGSTAPNITGTTNSDFIYGRDDNDTIISGGGLDYIYGGKGNDAIVVSDLNFGFIDGGEGTDKIVLNGSYNDFSTLPNDRIRNVEIIHINGGKAALLSLDDIFDMTTTNGNNKTMTIKTEVGQIANLYMDFDLLPNPTSGGTEVFASTSATGNLSYFIGNYNSTGINLTLVIEQGGASDGIRINDI